MPGNAFLEAPSILQDCMNHEIQIHATKVYKRFAFPTQRHESRHDAQDRLSHTHTHTLDLLRKAIGREI